VIEAHPAAHVGKAVMFAFEGSTNGHRFCAIRNCAGQGVPVSVAVSPFDPPPDISTKAYAAAAPGIGLGTIIQGNQFANVYYGLYGSQQPVT
jgi:hypothetical protein